MLFASGDIAAGVLQHVLASRFTVVPHYVGGSVETESRISINSDRKKLSGRTVVAALMLGFSACSAAVPPPPQPEPGKVFVGSRLDPKIRVAALAGGHSMPPDLQIKVHVYVTMLHEDEFNRISEATLDRNSPFLGHSFTPDELKKYARPLSDYKAIERWLTSYGIKVLSTGSEPLGGTIRAQGTVAQFEAALNIRIYQSVNGMWFANMSDPQIPADMKGIIAGFAGLDDLSAFAGGPGEIVQ